jgi:ribosomal protein S18 acetylase RimI-like enzyme
MNKWSMYFKEREGFETIENEIGLAAYRINGEECYIKEIYVLPEFRKSHAGSGLADSIVKIAKDKGCRMLTGSVVPSTVGASVSMMAMLKYGFKIHSAQNDFIVMSKEI